MNYNRVLTIQDISCLGQCSLTVALPILSACGQETVILPSALLSTHSGGFKDFTFRDLTDDIPAIQKHWQKEGIHFDAIYTGYLGSIPEIHYVSDILDTMGNSHCVKIVDPAMADHGKLYSHFTSEYAAEMTSLCQKADIIIPNMTEACMMTGLPYRETYDQHFVMSVLEALRAIHMKTIILTGMPLLINETLWSLGIAVMNQCYSTCGLNVVPALNISTTLFNLTSVVFHSLGVSVGILMGQMLGASTPAEEVKSASRKLIALSVASGLLFGLLSIALSGVFPHIYNTSLSVRQLASRMIIICSLFMAFDGIANASYFLLRSGGQTYITFLFDCGFVWACMVPLGLFLSRVLQLGILPLYFCCQCTNVLKAFLGIWFLNKGAWIQNLTID